MKTHGGSAAAGDRGRAQRTRRWAVPLTVATLGAALALPALRADAEGQSNAALRLPMTITGGEAASTDTIAEERVDFGPLLSAAGIERPFDEAALAAFEADAAGQPTGAALPVQFDEDAPGAASGTVLVQLPGVLDAGATRRVVLTVGDGSAFAPHVGPAGQVTVDANASDEGQSAFKITTPRAEWYLQKSAGAFSSAVDAAGVDWIGFKPGAGTQFTGEYRGIGQLNDNWFHPGGTQAATTLVSSGTLKATFEATATVASGTWRQRIEVYPTFVRSSFTQTGSESWWFLYEGTPGGDAAFGSGAGTVYRSDGGSVPFNGSFSVDMAAPNWVAFAVPGQNRSIFFSHQQADGEEGYHSAGAMTVFGFGRNYPGDSGKIAGGLTNQTFTYGILETANQAQIGAQVAAINSSNDSNIDPGGATTATTATTPTTPTTAPPPTVTQPSQPPTAAAGFVPVTPTRLLDTRDAGGPVAAGAVRTLTVRGAGTPVNGDAEAVVLNVTAVNATTDTFVRVWPSGTATPATSSLNLRAGDTVPNLVTTAVGSNGAINLQVSDGQADLLVDVVGAYRSAATTGGYHGVNPVRALDTRDAGGPIAPGGSREVDVATALGINPASMAGVALNVTVTGPTAGGYVSVYPAGGSVPNVSNLNFAAGQTVANAAVVGVGSGAGAGRVTVFNPAGNTHVVVDVVGWYETGSGGARFHAVAPVRAFDTRDRAGRAPVTGGQFVTGAVSGASLGVDPAATAVVSNITVTEATANAFVTAWPTGEAQPWASMQNTVPGTTRANQAMVKVGTGGQINVLNSDGSVHIITDVVGYFS